METNDMRSRGRVLVLEDNATDSASLAEALQRLGHHVTGPLRDASETIRIVQDEAPEVVVADIGSSGGEGLRAMIPPPASSTIPLILVGDSDPLPSQAPHSPYALLIRPFRDFELDVTITGAVTWHRRIRELTRSNLELARFAHVASHDLREPLRMVSSFMDLLDRRAGESLDSDTREYVAFAADGAKRMERMLDDLLVYSKVGRPDGVRAKVDLTAVVHDTLSNLAVLIEETGAEIRVGELPSVNAVAGDCLRLFQNLISNSIKYRRKDTPVVIEIDARDLDEGKRIVVSDNGRGIENPDLEFVFDPFYRGHFDDVIDGTGIGLASCRKIMESIGGEISVRSEVGRGTVFFLDFLEE